MGHEPAITLSIKEAGEHPASTYHYHILLNGSPITSNQSLSLPESQAVREISRNFAALFEGGCRPEKDADAQRALGRQLFNLWLAPFWEKIRAAVPVGSLRFLVIASEVPEILNLPWEMLLPPSPEGDFLGIDPLFRIRRVPSSSRQMAPFTGELRPGPLRLLLMASSPLNLPELDYEKEEEALFRAIYGQDVAFDSCDLGSFEELKEKVSEFQPHIVHLTGHGAVMEGEGRFAFEKEDGTTDLVPSTELRRFLAGSGVQCVFVSGCQSGKAPREALAGICQGLVGGQVALAVGWAASIADDLATNFARTFYRTLKDGQPVDRALLLARQEAWTACKNQGDPSWTLPVIYSATDQIQIFDPKKPPETLNRRNEILAALPGMKEGYAEHFVGRRREQQRLLPALRSGDLQAVIITGMGGSGKSTLATRLARKLETGGFTIIPVPSSRENPLSSARLLQAFGDAFRQEARKMRALNAQKADELSAIAEDLNKPKLSVQNRLRDAVAALNEGRFLLLLDNFESNIDEADRHILDSELSEFYQHLLEYLSGGSRAIITTRYPPSDVPVLPPKICREDLGDFPESSFLKIMQRDPEVERRIRSGELPMPLLSKLYEKFGGTPRFLIQIREAVKQMGAEILGTELAKVELPTGIDQGELERLRDKYFGGIFIDRLFGYLSPESQKALCRAAVYGVPVTLEGLTAVSGESPECVQEFVRIWRDRAFAYEEARRSEEPLWIVYGLLRNWLVGRLPPEDQKAAHRAAGDFMEGVFQKNRSGEMGLSWMDCLMEARSQFLHARAHDMARIVTDRLSSAFIKSGLYDGVRLLNAELLEYKEHPAPMSWIAQAYLAQGEYDSAQIWYQRCSDASLDSNLNEESVALHGMATIDLRKGDYEAAREKFENAMKIMQQIGDQAGEASTWHQLATIDLNKGDYEAAREKFETAMKIRQQIGDQAGEASTWHQLATIDLNKGDYEAAREKFETAMKIRQQIGDQAGEASTWHQLATIDLNNGDYEAAREKFETAMKIMQQIGDQAGEASTWHQLATIDLRIGDYEAAREKFETAMKIRQQIGDQAGEASTWHQLATIDLRIGDYEAAREKFEKSIKIMQQIGNRAGEASTWHQLATIDLNNGDYEAAREKFETAMKIMQQIGDQAGEASTWHQLATIDLRIGDYEAAREKFDKSMKIRQQIGDRAGEAATFSQLGVVAWENDKSRDAVRLIALGYQIFASISHSNAKVTFENLCAAASQLSLSQEQFDSLQKEVVESYSKDRGQSLLAAAFPKARP
ncbi:MAG TPA: tetratricopeptide repeat protein [Methanothrix sp.]|nr:tetratricopeptide repeat protein [Methanothrix sp.]